MRDGEQVGDGAAVAAARLAEAERGAGLRAVGVAGREAPVAARVAGPARHLERDEDAVADRALADVRADRDDLGDRLVADGERAGEDAEPGHDRVEVAAGDGERADDHAARVGGLRVGRLLPRDPSGLEVRELTHGAEPYYDECHTTRRAVLARLCFADERDDRHRHRAARRDRRRRPRRRGAPDAPRQAQRARRARCSRASSPRSSRSPRRPASAPSCCTARARASARAWTSRAS